MDLTSHSTRGSRFIGDSPDGQGRRGLTCSSTRSNGLSDRRGDLAGRQNVLRCVQVAVMACATLAGPLAFAQGQLHGSAGTARRAHVATRVEPRSDSQFASIPCALVREHLPEHPEPARAASANVPSRSSPRRGAQSRQTSSLKSPRPGTNAITSTCSWPIRPRSQSLNSSTRSRASALGCSVLRTFQRSTGPSGGTISGRQATASCHAVTLLWRSSKPTSSASAGAPPRRERRGFRAQEER